MQKQTTNFYNRFSFFYPLVDYFLKPQKRVLVSEINQLAHGHLLEIGVGNGTHLKFYNKHQIIGIDISSTMLKHAKKQKNEGIELMEMNGEQLLFEDQKFDYVVISHVIAVTENPEKLLNETFRVLKPDGKLFILNHFTPNNWLKYLDRSFQLISGLFHFKAVFKIENLQALKKFTLKKEVSLGKLSYFKLLIYQKK
jgi:phosphatidylethanolamine/phosphatidyl-N-methylethanolamine N-methyltransferase